jgi:predicted RNase H-like HicB family nuclease
MNHARLIRGYKVIIEPDLSGGFFAIVPGLAGCGSQGETEDECADNVEDAIDAVLEVMSDTEEGI